MADFEPTTISPEYARYLRSGVWKCDKSPTGAHHWIEVKADGVAAGTFVCKHCWDNRRFPLSLGPYGR